MRLKPFFGFWFLVFGFCFFVFLVHFVSFVSFVGLHIAYQPKSVVAANLAKFGCRRVACPV